MRKLLSALIVTALFAGACGKSEEQKQAEQAAEDLKKAAEAIGQAAAQTGQAAATQGMTEAAKAMQGVAAALEGAEAGAKPVEPVAFQFNVLVGKRFMVTIEGRDIDDMKTLQDFASNFDFNAIAAAK